MIGPFLGPITGMSVANNTILNKFKDNYNVTIIDSSNNGGFENKEDQGKFKFYKLLISILKIIKSIYTTFRRKYNVVYITPGQSYLGFMRYSVYIIIGNIKRERVFIHIHGSRFRKMYDSQSSIRKKIILGLIKKCSGIIVLGESLKSMFDGLVVKEKIFCSENGVECYYASSKGEIQNKIDSLKKGKKKVLFLSNLMADKGILELLKASEFFKSDELVIDFAGEIEPTYSSEIKMYFAKYKDKLNYHGVVTGKEKKMLLQNNDIFILPSKDEGQPISILEAYSNGLGVITDSNIGGIGDVFCEPLNGISCECGNYESIVQAIKKIECDGDLIKRNYEQYLDKYTALKFVDRIEGIIMGQGE